MESLRTIRPDGAYPHNAPVCRACTEIDSGRFVDYVANDLYSDSGEPSWRGMDALYAYGKPFLVAEWGLEGEDDVAFARRMFAWIERHPRTVGLVYFNRGWSGGTRLYELRTKPRSLRLYRREARAARFAATPGR